jgi:hypothetical protein
MAMVVPSLSFANNSATLSMEIKKPIRITKKLNNIRKFEILEIQNDKAIKSVAWVKLTSGEILPLHLSNQLARDEHNLSELINFIQNNLTTILKNLQVTKSLNTSILSKGLADFFQNDVSISEINQNTLNIIDSLINLDLIKNQVNISGLIKDYAATTNVQMDVIMSQVNSMKQLMFELGQVGATTSSSGSGQSNYSYSSTSTMVGGYGFSSTTVNYEVDGGPTSGDSYTKTVDAETGMTDGWVKTGDQDIDNDGTPNSQDRDMDGDGVLNGSDKDKDGDGVPNDKDASPEDSTKSITPESEGGVMFFNDVSELMHAYIYDLNSFYGSRLMIQNFYNFILGNKNSYDYSLTTISNYNIRKSNTYFQNTFILFLK